MANKRMFSRELITSDKFLELSASARALYLLLGVSADDEGFLSSYKSCIRLSGATTEDLQELVNTGFVIPFYDHGVIVLAHWKINNNIRSDTFKRTLYQNLREQLIYDSQGVYKLDESVGNSTTYTECIRPVYEPCAQVRGDKVSIDKERGGKDIQTIANSIGTPSAPEDRFNLYGLYRNVSLTEEEYKYIQEHVKEYKARIDKASQGIKNGNKGYSGGHYEAILRFAREDGYFSEDPIKQPSAPPKLTITQADYDSLKNELEAEGIKSLYLRRAKDDYNVVIGDTTKAGVIRTLKEQAIRNAQ